MVVGRAGLATEIGVIGLVVTHKAHETRAGAAHAALEQLLDEEGGAGGDDLTGLDRGLVDHLTVAVFNLRDEDRTYLLTVVDGCAIGIDQLQQVDIAGTQSQRGRGIEFRLDTHGVGRLHDILDAALLTESDGHRVDTHGKGLLQGDIGS